MDMDYMTQNNTPKTKSKHSGLKTATPTTLLSTADNALRETMEYMEREAGGRVPLVQALAQSRNPAATFALEEKQRPDEQGVQIQRRSPLLLDRQAERES